MKAIITGFWNKNKVFLMGLLGALAITLQEFTGKDVDLKVIAFAVLMTGLAFVAKEWRGQSLSITGLVGNAAYVFVTLQQNGKFTWQQLILQSIILVITSAMPDPKSRGYENTPTITAAKEQGEKIMPSKLTSK